MAIRAVPADTSPEAFRVMIGIYRAMPASRRLELALQMSDEILSVAEAGLRQRHPEYTEEQVRAALVRLRLGRTVLPREPRQGNCHMSQLPLFDALLALLDEAGIPFMVTGSYGSSHYGLPRTTNDLDLVIDPTGAQLDALVARLAGRFYVSAEAARDALRHRSMFNVVDFDNGAKADLVVRKDRPFSVEEFSRRRASSLHGRTVPVASAEDVILSKLEWDRLTPSERQVQDALNVAIVQWPRLDRDYLRRWAGELGVSAALEAVLQQASEANA